MESTLLQIIRHYEQFKEKLPLESGKDTLTDFVAYLQNSVAPAENHFQEMGTDSWKMFNRQTLMEMNVAYLGKMGRYVDAYSRKTMPTTALSSLEEFTYLIVLLQQGSMSKTELIQRNTHPITTGTEIIKRLIKKEFIEQEADPKDKRSMRILLTEKGKLALFSSAETTQKMAKLAVGILSDQELMLLLSMLKKLDDFHENVQRENKHFDLHDVMEKYF